MYITRTIIATVLGIASLVQHTLAHVAINELVADNENGIVDEEGKNEDWLELYNGHMMEMDISGYYLTDNATIPDKWMFPDNTTVGGFEYMIVWCDDDEDDGPLHTNFKLSKDGESVYLFDSNLILVSSLTYGELGEDESYGLNPDGNEGGVPVTWGEPTPGESNGICENAEGSYQGKDCNWVAANPDGRCGACSGNICAADYCKLLCGC
jgi:hypothetical protein